MNLSPGKGVQAFAITQTVVFATNTNQDHPMSDSPQIWLNSAPNGRDSPNIFALTAVTTESSCWSTDANIVRPRGPNFCRSTPLSERPEASKPPGIKAESVRPRRLCQLGRLPSCQSYRTLAAFN